MESTTLRRISTESPKTKRHSPRSSTRVKFGELGGAGNDDEHAAKLPFPSDIYGMVLLSLALFPAKAEWMKPSKILPEVITFLLFVICLVLQYGLCFAVLAGPLRASHLFYSGVRNHTSALQEAIRNNKTEIDTSVEEMCAAEHASTEGIISAYYFVIFLWIGRMLQELSETMWLMYAIWNVPKSKVQDSTASSGSSSDDSDCDEVSAGFSVDRIQSEHRSFTWRVREEGAHITKLGLPIRTSMLVFVFFTRVVAYILVQWVGIKFLIMAKETSHLIIKSLGFQYVLTIPSMLFVSTASAYSQKRVKNAVLHFQHKGSEIWDEWLSSAVRVASMIMGTTLVFNCPIFADIIDFRFHCQTYAREVKPFGDAGDGDGWRTMVNYLSYAMSLHWGEHGLHFNAVGRDISPSIGTYSGA